VILSCPTAIAEKRKKNNHAVTARRLEVNIIGVVRLSSTLYP
jgi:hypothetical protein